MKKIIIDTNALISFVTDRNPDQQRKIAEIMEEAAKLRLNILCPQNVLTEFVYVMDKVYNIEKSEIKKMIVDFIVMPGIRIVHEIDMNLLLEYWPEQIADYEDAMIAVNCKRVKGSMIATFDRKFRNVLKQMGLSVYTF